MDQLLHASRLYVARLTSKQHEILYLWTKCPKIFKEAIQQHGKLTPQTPPELRLLIESRFEIVRQLDKIFTSAPTLNSIKAPFCQTNLVRTLSYNDGFGGDHQIKAQIPHYSSSTTNSSFKNDDDGDTGDDDLPHASIDLTLRLDRNVPVLSISNVSRFPGEDEVLLPRNIKLNNIPPTWRSATCQVSLTRLPTPNASIEIFPTEPSSIQYLVDSLPPASKYLGDRDEWNMKRVASVIRIWQIHAYGWGIMQDDNTHWHDTCRTILNSMWLSTSTLREAFQHILDKIPHPRDVYPYQLINCGWRICGLPQFPLTPFPADQEFMKRSMTISKESLVEEIAAFIVDKYVNRVKYN